MNQNVVIEFDLFGTVHWLGLPQFLARLFDGDLAHLMTITCAH